MIKKNKTQLNYLYSEKTVNLLEECIKTAIKNGDCVTIDIDSIDDFDNKHFVIVRIKLFIKRLLRKLHK